jgi:hypothetical protein
MAHYALIDDNNIVVRVIVANQDYIDTLPDKDRWLQTSRNTYGGLHYDSDTWEPDGGVAFRKNYAGEGYSYDAIRDAFIPPKTLPSWVLNEDTCLWEAPIKMPIKEGFYYRWNEENLRWDEFQDDA